MGGEKLWHLHKEITGAYCYHKTIRYEKIHRKGMLFMEEKHLTCIGEGSISEWRENADRIDAGNHRKSKEIQR